MDGITDSFLNNTAYFMAGALAGYLFSRVFASVEQRAMHVHPESEPAMPARNDRVVRAVVALTIGTILFGSGVFTGFRLLNDEVQCFDNYANGLADSLAPRQKATETYQLRQDDVFDATERLLSGDKTGEGDLREALTAYRVARVELEEQRAANPYPEAPREVCE